MKKCLVFILLCIVLVGCNASKDKKEDSSKYKETDVETNYVKIDTNKGDIIVELYPEEAPITVANFKKLVASDFYSGVIFHRVVRDFVIQAGIPTNPELYNSYENIKGEFASNGIENNISHTRGVISMARAEDMNSASTQFFIVHMDSIYLDGNYAGFGKVIDGMEVVDIIARTRVDSYDQPITNIVINSITFVNILE